MAIFARQEWSKFGLPTTSPVLNANFAVSSGHLSRDGVVPSGSHHDAPFAQPGGALPVTGSFKAPPQLPGQHQQSSTSQSSRHSNSPHYPPGSNGLSQKRTRFGNPDFEFNSATFGQNGEFQVPIPKRICRLHGIYQGHGVQSQETKYRTS